MNDNRHKVDALLSMYQEYKGLLEHQSQISSKLAKTKILKGDTSTLEDEFKSAKAQLQALSDEMTFANPIVWMMYKFEAYKNEAQPIVTMHDFRVHCSKPGYICTKRFNFLNDQLARSGEDVLTDSTVYPDPMSLREVFESRILLSVSNSDDLKEEWNGYEYFTRDGIAAKWENYP